jgi:type IV secretory pathway TraG/TraD family ATPase VirD4
MTHTKPGTLAPSDKLFAGGIAAFVAAALLLWTGAATATWLTGRPVPRQHLPQHLALLLRHPANPSAAWGQPMPTAGWYWTITTAIGVLTTAVLTAAVIGWRRLTRDHATGPGQVPGLAGAREIARAAGAASIVRRAQTLRPSLDKPTAGQVGYRVGRAHGCEVWASAEDSLVVLGPPRAGKGLHLVIPAILDAPGAVITTSTRPDNLTATLAARSTGGRPVAVFDPQDLAPGAAARLRWSLIRGCENPQTAIIRARALAAGTSRGVESADFWQTNTESLLRCLLLAAALDGRTVTDLRRWTLSPALAGEAVRILTNNPRTPPTWQWELDNLAQAASDRARESYWAGVRTALASLADPRVLHALTPAPGEAFDPAAFLAESGTLYLLGTSAGAGACANIIAAWVEDTVEVARRAAAHSPGGRHDPPVALVLDEIANYALPSLPSLMSEGGGSGITTIAVLQSLAQARGRWGEHDGTALWDAASVKIVLGGTSNARDLADLVALIGDRDEIIASDSRDPNGRRTTSYTTRRVPILDASQLRTLPFGSAVVLVRSAAPIIVDLIPWTARQPHRR